MARYDVFEHPNNNSYLLDVQSDLLEILGTRVVVPLVRLNQVSVLAKRLNPVFEIKGVQVTMAPQNIATVPKTILKTPITNLKNEFDKITQALDMVFQGF